ncbi:MAG: hypothetical protein DLM67_06915 [Candidatus Nephthysia bennettiae]|nr:MAG: hypothetical protein DLM67_06915 [Candidatus Dormibacteraeota bacterium]
MQREIVQFSEVEINRMQFDKQSVINLIEEQMGSQHAEQAAQQLPDQVDHEQHADLLQQFGVNPQDLMSRFMK